MHVAEAGEILRKPYAGDSVSFPDRYKIGLLAPAILLQQI